MSVENPTPNQFYGNSPKDIRLSLYEYYDLTDALMDDNLSAGALMKFKQLFKFNSLQQILIPFVSFPFAWIANRAFFGNSLVIIGFAHRGLAQSRFNLMGMAIFYPLVIYYASTHIRIPRKLYTEVIANDGDDGEYVREMLKVRKPGLWAAIVPQL